MKVVTAEQIREMDRRAMEAFGMPGAVLMENAGRAVLETAAQEFGPLQAKRVVVFCGQGNNGGDGYVVARLLHLAGAKPSLYTIGSAGLKADARLHYEIACKLDIPRIAAEATPPENLELDGVAFLVDALLGTGVKDAPRGLYAPAIARMNASGLPVLAVDIPSGVNADTGATPGEAVRATVTVTFAYPKVGLLQFPGAACVGRLRVADIGFDWERLDVPAACRVLTQEELRRALKKRSPDSNKGDYGHVAVLAGSRNMAGAPALVARAAQHAGAGLVTVLAPTSVQPILAGKLDEQMTLPLPEQEGAVSEAAFDEIAGFAEKATVLCAGPGLTTHSQTVALIARLVAEIELPLVLDADGLNALAQKPEVALARKNDLCAPLVLTPHPGEAARLLGTSIAQVQSDRMAATRELAARYRAIVLLKGRHTLIADPTGNVAVNMTGNPGMATGGAGDTLTGIIGGLLAQSVAAGRSASDNEHYRAAVPVSTQETVALGVYLHGLAGDLAAAETGEAGLVAGDLIARLPAAIRLLEGYE